VRRIKVWAKKSEWSESCIASGRLRLVLLVALLGLGVGVTAATVALPAGASTAAAFERETASGSLQVKAKFGGSYRLDASCPAGTPATTDECVPFLGGADVRGLGHVVETYTKSFDGTICPGRMLSHSTAVLEITGKGTIEVAMEPWPTCTDSANSSLNGVTALLEGRIVHGTQKFAGASGNLKITNHLGPPSCGTDGCQGSATDTWTGTLVVPDFEFDLTAPVLRGAAPKSVTAPSKAKFLRVRYSVTAQDAVDRSVPASCQPASSSRFKIGRTKVTCTAKDTSANIATATFTVTVTRRR
jgi:HYR domain